MFPEHDKAGTGKHHIKSSGFLPGPKCWSTPGSQVCEDFVDDPCHHSCCGVFEAHSWCLEHQNHFFHRDLLSPDMSPVVASVACKAWLIHMIVPARSKNRDVERKVRPGVRSLPRPETKCFSQDLEFSTGVSVSHVT